MLVLLRSAPLFTSMPPSLLLLLLLLSRFPSSLPFLSSPSLSLLHCPPAGCMQAMQYTHSHTQSKYGCVLPSTDARRITVREITVNICSMNMMRLAERRRGEEDNLLCHLSLYGCLYYSLPLFIPPCPSLTHSLPPPLFFCLTVFPSHPLFIHFQSFSRSAKLPPSFSFSFTLISPLAHFSFPASSLRMPSLICLI